MPRSKPRGLVVAIANTCDQYITFLRSPPYRAYLTAVLWGPLKDRKRYLLSP